MLGQTEVVMTRIQFILILAGLFQIISQGMDQFVIQKEQVIRNIENNISKKKYIYSENISSNKAYYESYSRLTLDADLKLKLKNDKITNQNLKIYLLRDKNILLKQFELILSNPYIDIEDSSIYLKYFDEIDLILNNQVDIRPFKNDLSHNFKYTGLILNDLMEKNIKLDGVIQNLEIKLFKTIEKKFIILILGLITNTLSIFFILLFFYYLYRPKKTGK